jgi:hypothetical protein
VNVILQGGQAFGSAWTCWSVSIPSDPFQRAAGYLEVV